MDSHDHGVREAERQAATVKGSRYRQCHQQESRHAAEQHQPARSGVGGDGVGEPRIAAVHPEDDRQQYGYAQQVQQVGIMNK
jgi:hypothetical protein